MSIVLTAFTQRGIVLAERLAELLGREAQVWTLKKLGRSRDRCYTSLSQWTGEQFRQKNDVIFVSAVGIAVRTVAPWLEDKLTDPAVVVIDEAGRFVVPILSGHVGGANALARRIARLLNAQAVISTATDLNGCFAVDEWAARNGMKITNRQAAKEISARLLSGQQVWGCCEFPHGSWPEGIQEGREADFAITCRRKENFLPETLVLHPPVLVVGIGCKRGLPAQQVGQVVEDVFKQNDLDLACLSEVASIDLKKEDAGIARFCEKLGVPSVFYTAEQLGQVEGDFTPSNFVQSVTGVDNVCERSAVLSSGGRLLVRKTAVSGVTVAVAQRPFYAELIQRRK